MKVKPNNRKDLRLKGYDYSTPGGFFVTICTANRVHSLGAVVGCNVVLTGLGVLTERVWLELPSLFDYCTLMDYVVMPNHFHGIVVIEPHSKTTISCRMSGTTPGSLGTIIQAYKSRVTRMARKGDIWSGVVWQRGYHDHVIRNDGDLEKIQEYISSNPLQWQFDKDNQYRAVVAKPDIAKNER